MLTLWVLIALSILLALIAAGFYIWANQSGQYDDLESPASKIIFDDSNV